MSNGLSRRELSARMLAALGLSAIGGPAAAQTAASTSGQPAVSAAKAAAGDPLPRARLNLGAATPFSLDVLKARAQALARRPWARTPVADAATLQQIDFDAYQKIRFRKDMSLWGEGSGPVPVQFFHLGRYFMEPVRIHAVADGESREVLYTPDLFEMPADHVARKLPSGLGFAGFRAMSKDMNTDWLACLGASYFRTSGPYNQYGLSARGLAIDTGLPTPEEFPRFTEFWLEEPRRGSGQLTVYALLDSPSVAGAYKIQCERMTNGQGIHRVGMEIETNIYARSDVKRLGIAPFSSMYWYGKTTRRQAVDWRPEIHDSDGLAIWTGSGERIWRPINNPPQVMTNSFVDKDIKGFGLMQRDRDFVHYLDDGVFYERRPSVWVEPLDGWGTGALQLLEIPTDDETADNIAVYWSPTEPFTAGAERRYRYKLTWLDEIAFPETLAFSIATWTGLGGVPGQKRPQGVRKFVIDFQGAVFDKLGRNDGVELIVTASRGTVSNSYNHPVVDQVRRWRALFDITAEGREPVDLRAFLKHGDRALSETWIFQHFPEA